MAVLALALAVLPAAASAGGTDPNAKATFIGAILPAGKTATLLVRYQCASGTALWISVTQTRTGAADPRLKRAATSRAAAATRLQSRRHTLTCNGRRRRSVFAVDSVDPGSRGAMRSGVAWVQFRVSDGRDVVLSHSGWVNVNLR